MRLCNPVQRLEQLTTSRGVPIQVDFQNRTTNDAANQCRATQALQRYMTDKQSYDPTCPSGHHHEKKNVLEGMFGDQ